MVRYHGLEEARGLSSSCLLILLSQLDCTIAS